MYSMEMNNLLNCTNMEQMYFDLLSGPLLEDDDKDLLDTLLDGDLPFDLIDTVDGLDVDLALGGEELPEIVDSAEEEVDVVSIDDDDDAGKFVAHVIPPAHVKDQPTPEKVKKPPPLETPVVSSSLLDRMKAASAKRKGPILIQPPERGRPATKSDGVVPASTIVTPACPAATPDHDYCTAAANGSAKGVSATPEENLPEKSKRPAEHKPSRSPSPPKQFRSRKRSISCHSSRSTWSRGSRSSSPSSRSSSCGSSDSSIRGYSRNARKSRGSRNSRNSTRPHRRHKEPRKFMPSPPRRRMPDGQKEERRVIYVGNIPEGTTRTDLRQRFGHFGHIEEVSVHFRDRG